MINLSPLVFSSFTSRTFIKMLRRFKMSAIIPNAVSEPYIKTFHRNKMSIVMRRSTAIFKRNIIYDLHRN